MAPLAILGTAARVSADIVQQLGPDCRAPEDSVIAMICDQVSRGRKPFVENEDRVVELDYADGVRHRVVLRDLVARMSEFPRLRTTSELPDFADDLTRRLYATWLTSIDPSALSYGLDIRSDARGCLASILRSPSFGQILVSRSKPGVIRGNHYHNVKSEKFLVVEGEALVRLRRMETGEVVERLVTGGSFEFVDVPPGYAHSIRNVGTTEMVLIFWTSEGFQPGEPDTFPATA